jgi:hypothetical protein
MAQAGISEESLMWNHTGNVAETYLLRAAGALLFVTSLGAMPGPRVQAQSLTVQPDAGSLFVPNTGLASVSIKEASEVEIAYESLPDAPGQPAEDEPSGRSISGTVTDANGAVLGGAKVTLAGQAPGTDRVLVSDGDGYFNFAGVEPGMYRLTITSAGFMAWVSPEIVLHVGESYDVPRIVLQVAGANTNVNVFFTQHDVAEEELKAEEKQRVLGVFPNFWVSYVWDAAPLSMGQKFQLAFRSSIDPVSFLGAAFGAGLEQWRNSYPGYGEGAKGYFTRMGASYGDGFNSSFIAGAILPTLFHQDPRYFYKGTGTIRQRALYAISTVVICKGDNGRWEPNYSNVLGNFASGALSNAYYPAGSRGVRLTLVNATLGTASGAIGDLIQEFLLKKISKGVSQP